MISLKKNPLRFVCEIKINVSKLFYEKYNFEFWRQTKCAIFFNKEFVFIYRSPTLCGWAMTCIKYNIEPLYKTVSYHNMWSYYTRNERLMNVFIFFLINRKPNRQILGLQHSSVDIRWGVASVFVFQQQMVPCWFGKWCLYYIIYIFYMCT